MKSWPVNLTLGISGSPGWIGKMISPVIERRFLRIELASNRRDSVAILK